MKRAVAVSATGLSLAAFLVMVLTGCSAKKEPEILKPQAECEVEGIEAPNWVCGSEKINGTHLAVGSAKMSKMGYGFSIREAEADAKSALSQRVQTEIKDKVERFARSVGVPGENEAADKVTTLVSKQIAHVTFNDSQRLRVWQHPENKSLFVLIGVESKNINLAAKNNVLSSYRNEAALWQILQSEKAMKALEEEFAPKEPASSALTSKPTLASAPITNES